MKPFIRRLLKHPWFASEFLLMIFCAAASTLVANRQIVINTSASVSPGLYRRTSSQPAVGTLVDFRIPVNARAYIRERTGKDGDEWFIIKPIIAGPGDAVDTRGAWLMINGRRVAPMPPSTDASGRILPSWHHQKVLGAAEFFVFSSRVPNSFDSRCYGPITSNQISAVRVSLFTW